MKLMTVPHALSQHQRCPNQNKTCKHYVNISLGTILYHDSESELSADNFLFRPELLYLSVYGSADPIFQVLENKNNGFLLPKSFIFPENSCMIIRAPVFTTHLGPINACFMACIVLCFKRFNDHKPKRV